MYALNKVIELSDCSFEND